MSPVGSNYVRKAASAMYSRSAAGAPFASTAAAAISARSSEEVRFPDTQVSVWAPRSADGAPSAIILPPPKPYQQTGRTYACNRGGGDMTR